MTNKTIFITGALNRLGRLTAKTLAHTGHTVRASMGICHRAGCGAGTGR